MPRSRAASSLLARLLEAAGYRTEARPAALFALRARDHRAVVVLASSRSPTEVEGWFPADAIHRTIVYDDDPGTVVRALAADRAIEVLGPSTLGPALGELLLFGGSEAGGEPLGAEGSGELEPPWSLSTDSERTVRARIGPEEAEAISGVGASRFVLRLVPFYVAAYHVRPPSPHGEAGRVVRQLVAVNALSRRAEVWDDLERELVADDDVPYPRFAPQLPAADAATIAREAVRHHHTVHVDHTEQHGGALVIEARRIAPTVDDVRLGPLVLLYVPYWYAEGSDGRVVLDAVSGRRVTGAEADSY